MHDNERTSYPRSLRVLPGPTVAFGIGLVLSAAPVGYDLAHWNQIFAVARTRDESMDEPAAELMTSLLDDAQLVMVVLSLCALAVAVPMMFKGRRWAYVTTCVAVLPYPLCCGLGLANVLGGTQDCAADPNCLGPIYDGTAPGWVTFCTMAGPLMTMIGATTTAVLLFLPDTRRFFRASTTAVPNAQE